MIQVIFFNESKSVYSDFLNEKQNKSKNYKINLENDKIYTPNKLTMYFLECVVCCNNIYKNRNNEISGNLLEQEIIEILKRNLKKSVSREKETKQLISYSYEKSHSSFCNLSGSRVDENDDDELFNIFKNENIQEYFQKNIKK